MGKKDNKKAQEDDNVGQIKTLLMYGAMGIVGLSLLAGLAHTMKPGPAPPAVTVLSDDSFASFVDANPAGALVAFHTPTCTHCVKLMPEFELAAQELKDHGNVKLASLDGEAHKSLAKQYEMTRYPTVIWFKAGERINELHPMSRTKDKIVTFVNKQLEPGLVEIETRKEFDEALDTFRQTLSAKSPPVIVGFEGNAGVYAALEASADRLRGRTVFLFIKESGEGPALRSYGSTAAEDTSYDGPVDQASVLKWVKSLVPDKK